MKKNKLRFFTTALAILLMSISMPISSSAAQDMSIFNALQNATWDEASLTVLKSDPEISSSMDIITPNVSANSSNTTFAFDKAYSGTYYKDGSLNSGDLRDFKVEVKNEDLQKAQRYCAFRFKGSSTSPWIICPYSNKIILTYADGSKAPSQNDALADWQKYSKNNGYKAALDKAFGNSSASTAIEKAIVAYKSAPEQYKAEPSDKQKKDAETADILAKSTKRQAIYTQLKDCKFCEDTIDDEDISLWISEYALLSEIGSKYGFVGISGTYIDTLSSMSGESTKDISKYTCPNNDRCAIKLNITYDDSSDPWYIVRYAKSSGTSKEGLMRTLGKIEKKVASVKSGADIYTDLGSDTEAEDEHGILSGSDEDVIPEAEYIDPFTKGELKTLPDDPLDLYNAKIDPLDDPSSSVAGDSLKGLAAGAYRIMQLIAIIGFFLSIAFGMMKITFFPKEKGNVLASLGYKTVLMIIIFGFCGIITTISPIITDLINS